MIGMSAACARARAGWTASELSGQTTIAFTFWVMNVSMSESCLSTLRFASVVFTSSPCLAASAFRPPSSSRRDGSAPCGIENPTVPFDPASGAASVEVAALLPASALPESSSSLPHALNASANAATMARIANRVIRDRSARIDVPPV